MGEVVADDACSVGSLVGASFAMQYGRHRL